MQENLGLILNKQIRIDKIQHTWITNSIVDLHILETANASAYLFPLYLYPDPNEYSLFSNQKISKEKQPNISPKVFSALSKAYKTNPTPEDIFFYIYAVFYSNTYRTKYSEFLKIDFPRVPFTKDKKLFKELGKYGKSLADLHLLKSKEIDPPAAKFQGEGDKRVDKLKYDKNSLRVYINREQYFEKIPKEIWEYQIGGYQVLSKWLKDRKGKILSLEDVKHYCKIVTSIKKTIDIQNNIDALYGKVEKDIVII
jgi:predicted helicase